MRSVQICNEQTALHLYMLWYDLLDIPVNLYVLLVVPEGLDVLLDPLEGR